MHERAAQLVEKYSGELKYQSPSSFDSLAVFLAKNAVSYRLFYTAEYLMSLNHLTPEHYYEEIVKSKNCNFADSDARFSRRALKFDNPVDLLKKNYYVAFAFDEPMKEENFELVLEKNEFELKLIKELAKYSHFLRRAFEENSKPEMDFWSRDTFYSRTTSRRQSKWLLECFAVCASSWDF